MLAKRGFILSAVVLTAACQSSPPRLSAHVPTSTSNDLAVFWLDERIEFGRSPCAVQSPEKGVLAPFDDFAPRPGEFDREIRSLLETRTVEDLNWAGAPADQVFGDLVPACAVEIAIVRYSEIKDRLITLQISKETAASVLTRVATLVG